MNGGGLQELPDNFHAGSNLHMKLNWMVSLKRLGKEQSNMGNSLEENISVFFSLKKMVDTSELLT